MSKCFSPLKPAVVLSALLLCGCANGKLATEGAPPLGVDLAALDTCSKALSPVSLPAVTAATDARDAFVKDDAALIIARGEIKHGRDCIGDVQKVYAAPAKAK